MSVAWKKLIDNLLKTNNAVFGFIRKLEVTRNSQTNQAHPHYHVLLQVSESYFAGHYYISRERWLQMWQKAMKDDRITQVDVRAVKPGDTKAIVELTKYELKASKFADLSQLKRIRRFSSGGTLKILNLDGITPDDVSE
jgi:plasmid rolling circle replication initiator protein Rep